MRVPARWAPATVADAVLAVVLAAAGVVATASADAAGEPDRPLDALGIALVVAAALALAFRRRHPLATLVLSTVLTSTYLVVGYTYGPILVSFLIAVYTAARHLPTRQSLTAAAVALPVLLLHLLTNSAALPGFLGVVPGSAWVVVPYALGASLRQNALAAERARTELVRERVADERLRVAQEVHDVVGHGLAAIKMQADVALHVLGKRPEQAETALEAISRTSTDALDELRSTLDLVRGGDEAARAAAPGLDRLDDLVRRMGDAGVRVRVEVTGTPRRLPESTDLVAYRVLQESLTNVLRHSSGSVATVRLAHETDAVTLTVSSLGARHPSSADGIGIAGMRRRVESLGGRFGAGPTSDDRFEVCARLPATDGLSTRRAGGQAPSADTTGAGA